MIATTRSYASFFMSDFWKVGFTSYNGKNRVPSLAWRFTSPTQPIWGLSNSAQIRLATGVNNQAITARYLVSIGD